MNINLKHIIFLGISLFTISCVPDSADGDGNGLGPLKTLDATFAVAQTSANHYKLSSKDQSYMLSKWDLGDGAGFYNGKMVEDIFLPDAGVYKVQHQAVGQGGIVGATASQTITVDNPDPVAGNLVQGGKFLNSADVAKWSFSFPNPAGTALWTFNNGSATIVAQNYQGNVMYQAINVVAGRTYKADAVVSSNGVVNSLLEIYVGYKKPSLYSDYTGDGTDSSWLRAINTWAGSGTSPFSGKISVVGSQNPTNPNGTFTATQTGLVYFAIRALGADMKAGITISNVEFRGSN